MKPLRIRIPNLGHPIFWTVYEAADNPNWPYGGMHRTAWAHLVAHGQVVRPRRPR